MSNNEINFGDLLPPEKGAEKFQTSDTAVPDFIKQAAYTPEEVLEETIQKDWLRLVEGLSDYVLAEQLTERELQGMCKPLAENYAEYFHTTLQDVKKNRKKAEQKLYKMIPRHSQLDTKEFFFSVLEQNEKEKEARERSLEVYPPTGVAKNKKKASLEVEAEYWCMTCGKEAGTDCRGTHKVVDLPPDVKRPEKRAAVWTAPEAQKGSQTNPEQAPCSQCKKDVPANKGFLAPSGKLFCMPCHDAGHSAPPLKHASSTCEEKSAPVTIEISNVEVKDGELTVDPDICVEVEDEAAGQDGVQLVHLTKEAAAKWKPGQYLAAKHNGAEACVIYVNEDDKIYVVKVSGTLYPSYYSYEDAHETFDAKRIEDSKESPEAKSRGL